MKGTTLLLADDHLPVLDHLTHMLSDEFEIVGAFGDGQAAFEAASVLKPDVVVFDISMPVLSGLAAATRLAESVKPHASSSSRCTRIRTSSTRRSTPARSATFSSAGWEPI